MNNESATEILLKRGRGYLYRGKYPQVVVFTKSLMDIDKLKGVYGGNHYKHNSGYTWVLSSQYELCMMLKRISPNRSVHGFEDVISSHVRSEK